MAAKDEFGRDGEDRAARHLTERGYRILDRNWRCTQGEIDIVAERDGNLCIVEVKTRRSIAFGHPFEAVDERKRERLWRLAYAWCKTHAELAAGRMLRIEVIGIIGADPAEATIEHLVDLR
ncbi:YraN family protein [Microbacterium abyssi]|uniref:YraN family protein n=1 Tax=Microbacterium abyssi TaxID=2782166 RepID=UPI001886BE71|nr:YraN family protein [Microbacterium sp. A18JL241]